MTSLQSIIFSSVSGNLREGNSSVQSSSLSQTDILMNKNILDLSMHVFCIGIASTVVDYTVGRAFLELFLSYPHREMRYSSIQITSHSPLSLPSSSNPILGGLVFLRQVMELYGYFGKFQYLFVRLFL